MYLVYIRPIYEYACEVWDNCGICHSNKLEKLQLETARIVTGLPIFTKTDLSKLVGKIYIVLTRIYHILLNIHIIGSLVCEP